jgi:lipopolysaccharide cholinephosphotransferase
MKMEEDFSKYNGEGTTLRKAQLRMLDILLEIDKICKKHNIPYWISGGTLLGAVRHGGFIPWDDDLDIDVMWDDYKKLLSILEKELPEQYVVVNSKKEKNFSFNFSKVVDINSKVTFPEEFGISRQKHQGIWVDIFPVERGSVSIRKFIESFYGRSFRRVHHYNVNKFEYFMGCIMYPFALLLVFIIRKLNFLFPKDVLIHNYGSGGGIFHTVRLKSETLPVKSILFEGYEVLAPKNPDSYLTLHYGDYMQVPSKDKREIHLIRIELY